MSKSVTIIEGESRRLDFKIPNVHIYGKITNENSHDISNVIVSLMTNDAEPKVIESIQTKEDGTFSFLRPVMGNVKINIKVGGYQEVNIVKNYELGETKNLETIQLTPRPRPSGDGVILGRVFDDENPSLGLHNIKIYAFDKAFLVSSGFFDPTGIFMANTAPDGTFTISGLPNSGFVLYTDSNNNYLNEMHTNIIFTEGLAQVY